MPFLKKHIPHFILVSECIFAFLYWYRFSDPLLPYYDDPVLCEMSYTCNCCMSCTCKTCHRHYTYWPVQCRLGMVQLLYLQAKVFMRFASTCFSVCDSSLANPKWLKFKELSLGKVVPGILRQKSLEICHSVR